jgi:hypothetical protein
LHSASSAALGGDLSVEWHENNDVTFTANLQVMLEHRSGEDTSSSGSSSSSLLSQPDSQCRASQGSNAAQSALRGSSVGSSLPDEAAAIDTGLLPFLPPNMPPCESFDSMKTRGMLNTAVDLLLGNTEDAFLVGQGQKFIYASPGAVAMLGYERKEDLLG